MTIEKARLIQNADIEKVIFFEDQVLLTSHLFFNDGNDIPVALLHQGQAVFFDSEALHKREVQEANRREELQGWQHFDETAFRHKVLETLRAEGRKVRQEVSTPYGRIDILIDEEPPTIIELKITDDMESLFKAVGQLVFYSSVFPYAKLMIGCANGITLKKQNVLAGWGIHVL